jgi:restriction system protein
MVRAGQHGEYEQIALTEGLIAIDFAMPDLSSIASKEKLKILYSETFPDASAGNVRNVVGQIWRFFYDIKVGDLVALPLKEQRAVAIGRVAGDYEYREINSINLHTRKVNWLKNIPRSEFDQGILYSLGAFMTVCQISRNDAEKQVLNLLKGVRPPLVDEPQTATEQTEGSTGVTEQELIDIEEYSKDEITKYIERIFKGHGLARLIEALLKAQGYKTRTSPPGRDGGVDILAASGSLGFDEPRICVQVKSQTTPVDVKILRELRGVMTQIGAEQGLLVAWGGITNEAMREARDAFFSIRVWDQGNVLDEILKYYHLFDDELKAELPLKKIWSLVQEDSSS